ncbi:MAG: hypothetical protein HZA50_17925 [Planctomycetes bacterium]|nr:hypothetical protein [Planctomycetota bacterium]
MMKKPVFIFTLLLAAAGLCGCKAITEKNEQADALAKIVLDLAAGNESDKLFDQYGCTELKQQVTRETWADVIKKLGTRGKPKSHSRTAFEIKTENGITTGKYTYNVEWEKVSGTIELKTKWEDGQCRILGVSFPPK